MRKHDEQLLTILAKTDAIHWPIRNYEVPGRVLFYERRRDFATVGVRWISGALTDAARKAAARELQGLVRAGGVKVYNPKGSRVLGVKLMEPADNRIRRTIGLATYADSLSYLDELYRRRDDGFDCYGRSWTSEATLTGIAWGDNEKRGAYVLLTESLYPLLWRGLVESGSDIQGHVWYCLTDAGLELARERAESGKASRDYPPPAPSAGDEEAFSVYHAARLREVWAIERGKPEDASELGQIPLPVHPVLRRFAAEKSVPVAIDGDNETPPWGREDSAMSSEEGFFEQSDFAGYDAARLEAVIEEAHERFAATADGTYLELAHAAQVRAAQLIADGHGDEPAAEDAAPTPDGQDLICVFDSGDGRRIFAPTDGTPVAVRAVPDIAGARVTFPGGEVNLNQ